jgi:hypothetical protein
MDVLILNRDEGWQETIRFCIRSIEQYYSYDKLWVVGYLPDYLQCNHIQVEDNHDIPQVNVCQKIDKALDCVSNDFVLFHDDMYLLEEYKPVQYYHGMLSHKYDSLGRCKRKKCIANTLRYIGQGYNYELHYPMPMKCDQVRAMLDRYPYHHGIVPYSLYGNLYDSFPKEDRKDCKIGHQQVTESDIKGQTMFSTQAEGSHLLELMQSLYPESSPYEIDFIT